MPRIENTMKHLGFKFAMLSMALVALVGCSKEQSSFNIEDVSGKAKVMGTLTYLAGVDRENKPIVREATNVRVAVLVENGSLKNGSEGYTTYETVTNSQGQYTIEVPALDNGVNVKIIPDPFFGKFSTLVDKAKGIVVESEVLYKVSPWTATVIPNDIEVWDGKFINTTSDDDNGYGDNGYGDNGYGDDGYGDDGYGDNGYGDDGYGDDGYGDNGYGDW